MATSAVGMANLGASDPCSVDLVRLSLASLIMLRGSSRANSCPVASYTLAVLVVRCTLSHCALSSTARITRVVVSTAKALLTCSACPRNFLGACKVFCPVGAGHPRPPVKARLDPSPLARCSRTSSNGLTLRLTSGLACFLGLSVCVTVTGHPP